MNKDTIWIVDDDRSIRWVLERSFAKAGLHSESFDNGDAMLSRLRSRQPALQMVKFEAPAQRSRGVMVKDGQELVDALKKKGLL